MSDRNALLSVVLNVLYKKIGECLTPVARGASVACGATKIAIGCQPLIEILPDVTEVVPSRCFIAARFYETWGTPGVGINRLHTITNRLFGELDLPTIFAIPVILRRGRR